jgi:MFS family permease
MGLLSFITLGGTFILPFFLELVMGYPTPKVGLLMMATPVIMGIVSPISGVLSDRLGSRGISLLGLLVIFGGCLSLSTLRSDISQWGYLLRVAPIGLGMGLFQSPNNSAIMGAVPLQRLGVASGLMNLSRNLGQTAGIPLMGSIFIATAISSVHFERFTQITRLPKQALVAGITGIYYIAAHVILVSTIIAVIVLWLDRRRNFS